MSQVLYTADIHFRQGSASSTQRLIPFAFSAHF